jgi:hypothetical protein
MLFVVDRGLRMGIRECRRGGCCFLIGIQEGLRIHCGK